MNLLSKPLRCSFVIAVLADCSMTLLDQINNHSEIGECVLHIPITDVYFLSLCPHQIMTLIYLQIHKMCLLLIIKIYIRSNKTRQFREVINSFCSHFAISSLVREKWVDKSHWNLSMKLFLQIPFNYLNCLKYCFLTQNVLILEDISLVFSHKHCMKHTLLYSILSHKDEFSLCYLKHIKSH